LRLFLFGSSNTNHFFEKKVSLNFQRKDDVSSTDYIHNPLKCCVPNLDMEIRLTNRDRDEMYFHISLCAKSC